MHSMLEADNGITFMASDTPNEMEYQSGSNISMSLSGDNEAELRDYFQKLSDGGMIILPLEKALGAICSVCVRTSSGLTGW